MVHPVASANRLYVGRSRRGPLAIWGDKGWRRAAGHDRPPTWGRVINAMEAEALFPGATHTPIPVAILDSAGRLQGQSLGNLESSPEAQEAFKLLAFLEQQKPDLVEAARRWLRISEAA